MKNSLRFITPLFISILLTLALYSCEKKDPEPETPLEKEVTVTLSFHTQTVGLNIGDTFKLHHMIQPDTMKIDDLLWTSSNPAVATVSQSGLVTAITIGEAQIKLSSAKKKAETVAIVNVLPIQLTKIALEGDVIPAYISETKTLALTYDPDNASDKTVSWQTSDNSIVSVEQTGSITANKLGYAWVTAQHSSSVSDNAVIVPANKGQKMAASQINASGDKHYINVYAAALDKAVTINEVKLYLGSKGSPSSSELKTVSPALSLQPGKGTEIKIEVNATEANQLTFGRYIRIDATIGGQGYYVYVSWTNNIEIIEK